MIICIASMIVGTQLYYHSPSIIVKVIGVITLIAGATGFELIRIKEKKKLNATFGIVEYLNGFRIVKKKARMNGRIITVAHFIKDEPEEEDGGVDDLP